MRKLFIAMVGFVVLGMMSTIVTAEPEISDNPQPPEFQERTPILVNTSALSQNLPILMMPTFVHPGDPFWSHKLYEQPECDETTIIPHWMYWVKY